MTRHREKAVKCGVAISSLHHEVLDILSVLSLKLKRKSVLACYVAPAISLAMSTLDDIEDDISCITKSGFQLSGSSLSVSLTKPRHNRRHHENREYVTVSFDAMTHVSQAGEAHTKSGMMDDIKACLES